MLWDNIRTFYLLVKTQNIKLVASILNIHYSTIVRRIEALEKIFSINLFTNRKKIILTEFGEILNPRHQPNNFIEGVVFDAHHCATC